MRMCELVSVVADTNPAEPAGCESQRWIQEETVIFWVSVHAVLLIEEAVRRSQELLAQLPSCQVTTGEGGKH